MPVRPEELTDAHGKPLAHNAIVRRAVMGAPDDDAMREWTVTGTTERRPALGREMVILETRDGEGKPLIVQVLPEHTVLVQYAFLDAYTLEERAADLHDAERARYDSAPLNPARPADDGPPPPEAPSAPMTAENRTPWLLYAQAYGRHDAARGLDVDRFVADIDLSAAYWRGRHQATIAAASAVPAAHQLRGQPAQFVNLVDAARDYRAQLDRYQLVHPGTELCFDERCTTCADVTAAAVALADAVNTVLPERL